MGRILRWRRRLVNSKLFTLRDDPRDTPIYSVTEAAAYVGVPRSTLRHWLAKPTKGDAIIETPVGVSDLSFYNLLEAHILRVAIERDVKLPRIRIAIERLRDSAPHARHPLLEQELFTGGPLRSLLIKSLAGDIEDIGHGGQFAFRALIGRFLTRIDRDHSGPFRLRPYNFSHVAIDHRVSGGRPVIKDTGILIEMVASRRRAGETVAELAHDYNISTADVREALRYSTPAA